MQSKEIMMKKDITRLKHLLRDYRDHIITEICLKMPNKTIITVIQDVDMSINILKSGL